MKKFTLTAKRAKKVLALALTAALIVPAIPSQQVDADVETWVDLPEAVASYALDSADEFEVAEGMTGTAIKFTGDAVTATFDSVVSGAAQYKTTDKKPVMDGDKYAYEYIDTTPEIVEDEERGKVLSLKSTVDVPQYPSGAKEAEDIKQKSAKYYSAVEIVNPFTELRSDLYDASRYTWDKIYNTSTELTSYTVDWYSKASDNFADYKNRYSRPAAKTGVTISMWAQIPYDTVNNTVPITNFIEFYNNETVLYKTDDLAKNWVTKQYAAAVTAGTVNNPDSPFYAGEYKEATIVAVNSKVTENFSDITNEDVGSKFGYVVNYGMYGKWNPAIATYAVESNTGALKCWVIKKIDNKNSAGSKEIVVEAGEGQYAHLQWTDTVYGADDQNANLYKFASTEDAPYGRNTQYTHGSTGVLYLASNQNIYNADAGKTGIQQNPANSNAGTNQDMDGNSNLGTFFTGDDTVEGTLMNVVSNDETDTWHYLTYTITDEWIQIFIDGKAVDPSNSLKWNGKNFNMGSGYYTPWGVDAGVNKNRSDWAKIANDDMTGSLYGYIFGKTVMNYITDPNTKLYIGGKDQATYEGTMIDSIAFYATPFTREQVAAEYADRLAEESYTVGDVNEDGDINAKDALAILKHAANMEVATFNADAAETNGDNAINAKDALNILKYAAKMITDFPINEAK